MYSNLQLDALDFMKARNWADAAVKFTEDLQIQGNNCFSLKNLATCQAELNETEEAYDIIRFCTQLFPFDADSWIIYSSIISQLGDNDAAIEACRVALENAPEAVNARWNYSMFLMKGGRWKAGWDNYEWGFIGGHRKPRTMQPPLQPGISAPGKTCLIWGEQGAGDIIMFFRYIEKFREIFPETEVIFETRWDLIPLFSKLPYKVYARPDNGSLPYEFDCNISLLSLPRYLALYEPQVEVGYIPTDGKLVDVVKTMIPFDKTKPKIGLFWQGSPGHSNVSHQHYLLGTVYAFSYRV